MNRKFDQLKWTPGVVVLLILLICCQPKPIQKSDFGWRVLSDDPESDFSRNRVKLSLDWDWEEVGPDVQPQEMFPDNRALQPYAVGRGNGSGRVNRLYIDSKNKNRMFAVSPTGGLFISENSGENWENAGTDELPISGVAALALHPDKKKTWWITTGDGDGDFMFTDGVWRTNDGGKTYENINGVSPLKPSINPDNQLYSSELKVAPDNPNVLFLGGSYGLLMTKNALAPAEKVVWERIKRSHFYDIEFSPIDPDHIIAGGEKLLESTDGGETWKSIKVPTYSNDLEFPFRRVSVEWSKSNPNKVWIVLTRSTKFSKSDQGPAFLFEYDLNSGSWTQVRSLKERMNNVIVSRARAFAVSPKTDSLIMVGNVKPIYRSENGGRDFEKIKGGQMHDDIHHILFSEDGQTVWASHDGGVSVSKDQGLTWTKSDDGIGVANVFGLSVAQTQDERVIYGGYDTGGTILKDDLWKHINFGDGFEAAINPEDPNYCYSTRQNGYIHKSSNGGKSFDHRASGGGTKSAWHTWFKLDPSDPSIVYNAGKNVVRSSEHGENHEVIFRTESFQDDLFAVFKLWPSEDHTQTLYLNILDPGLLDPVIVKTHNSWDDPDAIVWKRVPDIPKQGWIMDIVVDPDNRDAFWLVNNDHTIENRVVYFNGQYYEDKSYNLGFMVAESLILHRESKRLYLGTNQGVYTMHVGGSEWTLLKGLPGCYIKSMDIQREKDLLYVGTFGRGIWKAPLMD